MVCGYMCCYQNGRLEARGARGKRDGGGFTPTICEDGRVWSRIHASPKPKYKM